MTTSKNIINNTKQQGFTIVELLVVIVVIGILAAITIVSYSGIRNRAVIASMQSDLSNASIQFKMFHIDNGYYPVTISTNCATTPTNTTNLCLKPSADNSFTTVAYENPTPQSFILTEVNGNNTYHITESILPKKGLALNPADWLVIGEQFWSKTNIDVGVMISGSSNQIDNGVLEKYCYENNPALCTTYGALYQWGEAMQYNFDEKARGICPVNSHISSDEDWKKLEIYLGMTQIQADGVGWRGSNQGTQLKDGGIIGFSMKQGGFRHVDGNFNGRWGYDYVWTSTESTSNAWYRNFNWGNADIERSTDTKDKGFSIRCVGD